MLRAEPPERKCRSGLTEREPSTSRGTYPIRLSFKAALALFAVATLPISAAKAAQALPEDLGVTLTIVEACEVGTIASINFGTQGSLASTLR